MSEINIKTNGLCSNLEALQAVCAWINANIDAPHYLRSRAVTIPSDRILGVEEIARHDDTTTTNADFYVTGYHESRYR